MRYLLVQVLAVVVFLSCISFSWALDAEDARHIRSHYFGNLCQLELPSQIPETYLIYNDEVEEVDFIAIVLDHQLLYAFSGMELVMAERISSAKGGIIKPAYLHPSSPHDHIGAFRILGKNRLAWSEKYHCYMPYALRYCAGHHIHQTGNDFYDQLGHPASHGCVREHGTPAHWLYERVSVGTPIFIVEN